MMNKRITELLEEQNADNEKLCVDAQNVLITGAAGTVGYALAKYLLEQYQDKDVIMLDHNDSTLNYCIKSLSRYENVYFYLGDYADEDLFERIVNNHGIDTIFHCAAYKIVPLVDLNPIEALKNNTFHCNKFFAMCGEAGIRNCIFMSSYEAYKPKNVFGDTKRIAEILMERNAQNYPNTKYCTFRFGFILNSSGSVIHIFEEQAKNGQDLTVTHREIERYVCSVREVVRGSMLLTQLGESGYAYTLNMEEPVKIYNLAEYYCNKYHNKSQIVITQLRPGDKIYEEFLGCEGGFTKTEDNKILKNKKVFMNWPVFDKNYNILLKCIAKGSSENIRDIIRQCAENSAEITEFTEIE